MASEKVSRKMVLEIKYVNANKAVIHTEKLVTGILAKISLGTGISLILDWENGIYSLGLGFSQWEWDEQL